MEPFMRGGFAIYALLLFIIAVTLQDAAAPFLLEKAICQQTYNQYGPAAADLDCKAKAVQKTLASTLGMIMFTLSALALTFALPFAWLAGRIEKTTLLLLGAVVYPAASSLFFYIVSHPQSFDIKAVLIPIILDSASGGPAFGFTLLYSILAEVVDPDELANTYFRLGALMLMLRFSVRSAAAKVLEINPLWIEAATPSVYAATIPLFLFRRLYTRKNDCTDSQAAYVRLDSLDASEEDHEVNEENDSAECASTKAPLPQSFAGPDISFDTAAKDLLSFFRRLTSSRLLRQCLAICFVKVLSLSVGVIEVQWISSRLGIDMSTALYFGSYDALASALVLGLLPYATRHLLAKLKVKQKIELHIMRLSMLVRTVGQVAFALSPGPITLVISITIFVLSSGAYDTFKSLITSFCAETDVTRLYLVLTAVDTAASIVGSLVYPQLLKFGLDHGYFGMCLPYMVAASCTFLVWVMLRGMEDMDGFDVTIRPNGP